MREILFRGKRTDNKQWTEGFYALIGKENPSAYIIKNNGRRVRVAHKSISEYTGLVDKNGRKIFEGDVLHFRTSQEDGFCCPEGTDIYYRVMFGSHNSEMNELTDYIGFFALKTDYEDEDLYVYGDSIEYLVNSHRACVIGNIHDNPELLEVQK